MVKNIIFPAACLLPLVAAQAAIAKPAPVRHMRSAPAPKLVAPPPPEMRHVRPSPVDFGDGRLPLERGRTGSRRAPQLVGALQPAENAVVGLGLWRVDKIDDVDPNRANPM